MSEKHPCCRSHCCVKHGCKYSYEDCPVVLGEEAMEFPCEDCDTDRHEAGVRADQVVMDRVELLRVMRDNDRLSRQVTELQMSMTMKEEHLRAHRRVPLSQDQRDTLAADLAETTDRIRKGYEGLTGKTGP